MSTLETATIALIIVSLLAANLPWLSERFFLFFSPPGSQGKALWMRLVEWFVLLCLFLLASAGVEKKLMGEVYKQDWEFYAVIVCLFVVFALPGFIYRHDLRPHFEKRKRRSK
jgi:hypothetical protein